MKKYLLLLICMGIFIPCKIYAVDITVGATTWYARPDDSEIDPAFFLGPALSVKLNDDFNLTFVYLYGKFNMKADDSVTTSKITRQDADFALNYRLADYFKLFGGIKYLKHSFTYTEEDPGWRFLLDFDVSKYDTTRTTDSFGPGLGLSVTYPILDNLFLLSTLSGFYLWENYEEKYRKETVVTPAAPPLVPAVTNIDEGKKDKIFNSYGCNLTLAIAYHIPSVSTMISLGGRYHRFIKTDDLSNDTTFYGVTLTATYSFSLN